MTYAIETCASLPMTGNGVTTEWEWAFNIPNADALTVIKRTVATKADEVLDPSSYSATGFDDDDGGTVTYPLVGDPMTSDYQIIIARDDAYSQETAFGGQQGGFLPQALESQLERIVMQTQQNRRDINNSIRLPLGADAIAEGNFWKMGPSGKAIDGGSAADITAAQGYAEAAATSAEEAEEDADRAELAASSIDLPTGVADTVLVRKSDNSEYEVVSVGLNAPNLISALSKWNTIWRYMEDTPATAGAFNAAWTALQAELVAGTTIEIPEASYVLNAQCSWLTGISQEIVCASGYGTIFTATSALTGGIMFAPADSNTTAALRWQGGYLNGAGYAAAGIASEDCIHYEVDGVEIIGTTSVALRLVGWSGRVNGRFNSNLGNGVEAAGLLAGVRGNNNLVYNIISYANGGYGAYFSHGIGVNISGSGIEGNKKGGLMLHDLHGFEWGGGYCERNGEDKTTLTAASGFSPEDIAIRADIFAFRTGRGLFTGAGNGVEGLHIDGVAFDPYGGNDFPTSGLGQDCIVFGDSFEDFHFGNGNKIREPERYDAVLGVYNHGGYTNLRNATVDVGSLLKPVKLFGAAGLTANTPVTTLHNLSNRFESDPTNYATQAIGDYPAVSGTTGTLAVEAGLLRKGFPVWVLGSGDKLWAEQLDLTGLEYYELVGKTVLFIYDYRIRENGSGIVPTIGGEPDEGYTSENAGGWQTRSIAHEVSDVATSLTYGFRTTGTVTNGPYISCLRLVIVGNSATDALRGKTF